MCASSVCSSSIRDVLRSARPPLRRAFGCRNGTGANVDAPSGTALRHPTIADDEAHPYHGGMQKADSHCDLDHARPRLAVVRVQVKSTRARRPGHPMIRELSLCGSHARQLREFGIEIVGA